MPLLSVVKMMRRSAVRAYDFYLLIALMNSVVEHNHRHVFDPDIHLRETLVKVMLINYININFLVTQTK